MSYRRDDKHMKKCKSNLPPRKKKQQTNIFLAYIVEF